MTFNPNDVDNIFSAMLALMLALPRSLMALRGLPIFFARTAPVRVRSAISVAFTLPLAVPIYHELKQRPFDYFELFWLMGKEVMVGFLLGFLLSLPFWILQIIGTWIDQQRGNNMFPNSPGSDPDALPTGEFLRQTGIIIFLQAGFLFSCFNLIIDSYQVWPAMNPIPPFDQVRLALLIEQFSRMFNHAVLYASPAIFVLLLIEFGFGILNIYTPQIQVTTATPALKSLAGMLLLMFSASTIWYVMEHEFDQIKTTNQKFSQPRGADLIPPSIKKGP
jgi:type III secretion protein T